MKPRTLTAMAVLLAAVVGSVVVVTEPRAALDVPPVAQAPRALSLAPAPPVPAPVAQTTPASAPPQAPASPPQSSPPEVNPLLWLEPARCNPDPVTGRMDCYLCIGDYECEPHEACILDRDKQQRLCAPSGCEDDYQCPAGWSCRTVSPDRHVRRCLEGGSQRPGQPCVSNPLYGGWACAEGLQCVQHACALPCGPRGECGRGEHCVSAPDGPACVPRSCTEVGCMSGQACKQVGPDRYACIAQVHGKDCFRHPCPLGEVCEAVQMGTLATFQCVRECSPLDPRSCPTDSVCGMSHMTPTRSVCYRACSHENPFSCPTGMMCGTVSEDEQTWGCISLPPP